MLYNDGKVDTGDCETFSFNLLTLVEHLGCWIPWTATQSSLGQETQLIQGRLLYTYMKCLGEILLTFFKIKA